MHIIQFATLLCFHQIRVEIKQANKTDVVYSFSQTKYGALTDVRGAVLKLRDFIKPR